jgi:hypothetical protein
MIHYDEELQQQISDFLSEKIGMHYTTISIFFPKTNVLLLNILS